MTLAELARWCRDNVPDGRVSMCRIEMSCGHYCPKLCGECVLVERRAKKALEEEERKEQTR